ncbi:hypothetical protein ES703_29910 [subsurface metagenome]
MQQTETQKESGNETNLFRVHPFPNKINQENIAYSKKSGSHPSYQIDLFYAQII